jgi:DeoR/GlpR family transcriptional regulator of sugar metabolism
MKDDSVSRGMRSIVRHQFILNYLKTHKTVDVAYLCSALNVSDVTIRKDLKKLEKDNLLVRKHGGAVLNDHLFFEPSFLEKEDQFTSEKSAIAEEAAKLIQDDMTIALSTGTTVSHLLKKIKDRQLTVATNAVNVVTELMGFNNIQLFLTGGQLRPNTYALVGEAAEKSLEGIYFDYAFFGINGFSFEQGLTTPSMEEARVVRKIIENAKHAVVLADHSKFNKVAFYRIVTVDRIHTVVTDDRTPPAEIRKLKDKGINVIVAKV